MYIVTNKSQKMFFFISISILGRSGVKGNPNNSCVEILEKV